MRGHAGLLEDVSGAEPDRGRTAVGVDPLVVGIRDVELARVLVGVAIGVADKRSLPLLRCGFISYLVLNL